MKLTKEQQKEINDLRSQEFKTKRVTAPELEKILFEAIPILDHGFIRVIDFTHSRMLLPYFITFVEIAPPTVISLHQ